VFSLLGGRAGRGAGRQKLTRGYYWVLSPDMSGHSGQTPKVAKVPPPRARIKIQICEVLNVKSRDPLRL
jgi:hypothetical protein